MTIKPEFGFILEYVTDIEAAKRFYINVMGLEVGRTSPVFVQFKHFAIASDEPLGSTSEPEVYWIVEDAHAAFTELSQKAEILLPLKQMPFGKVFGIKDPGGCPLYLIEFAKDRPSQSVNRAN